jgi:glycyl-tRNA synthetase
MSSLGPEFGEAAGAIAAELEALAQGDPDAFDSDRVTVSVDGESYEVPVEQTGFAVEELTESGEHVTPHTVEPSFGVDRLIYTVLAHAYEKDEVDGEDRTYLSLPPETAPTTVGVFPLMDKDGLAERAAELVRDLRTAGLEVTYDDSGAIGRRYRRQDEVGTPFCVTIDYETLEDGTVTVRERDSTDQKRIPTEELAERLLALRDGVQSFETL